MNAFHGRGGYTAWPNELLALALNARPPVNLHVLAALLYWMEFKPEGSDVRLPSGEVVHVRRGQVLVSYQGIADALRVSIDVARRSLRRLAAMGVATTSRAGSATSGATSPTLVDFGKWKGILWPEETPATPPAIAPATPGATPPATGSATPPATIQPGTPEPGTPEPLFSLAAEAQASDDAGAFGRVSEVWERVCVPVGFAKARSTAQQRKAARTRMREAGWFEAFEAACSYIAREPFYRGGSSSGWVATLGWLLTPGNTEKTAERAGTTKAAGRPSCAAAAPPAAFPESGPRELPEVP